MSTTAIGIGAKTDPALLAHLYRRAGFGATRNQVDQLAANDYADLVEFLLNPDPENGVPDDEIARYMGGEAPHAYLATWMYRMLNSRNQLQEKNGAVLAPRLRHRSCQERAHSLGLDPARNVPTQRHVRYANDSA